MSVSTAVPKVRKSGHNPFKIRRRVNREFTTPELAAGVSKSFTREGITHHPAVDLVTGACTCTCEQFRYRLAPTAEKADVVVSIKTPMLHCKHLDRFLGGCIRRGEITVDESKVLHLAHPAAAPVERIETPEHVDASTGEVRAGYVEIITPGFGFERGQWVRADELARRKSTIQTAVVESHGFDYANFFED